MLLKSLGRQDSQALAQATVLFYKKTGKTAVLPVLPTTAPLVKCRFWANYDVIPPPGFSFCKIRAWLQSRQSHDFSRFFFNIKISHAMLGACHINLESKVKWIGMYINRLELWWNCFVFYTVHEVCWIRISTIFQHWDS